ncbi:hypothetical protein, partial [Hydrogenophaga sp.]|uniref:hypothetical protein n=1 Tax=Hydrogenophaga sp. TaxID=1904254 RepID=UPI0027309D4E
MVEKPLACDASDRWSSAQWALHERTFADPVKAGGATPYSTARPDSGLQSGVVKTPCQRSIFLNKPVSIKRAMCLAMVSRRAP